jgi:hypothetical protein
MDPCGRKPSAHSGEAREMGGEVEGQWIFQQWVEDHPEGRANLCNAALGQTNLTKAFLTGANLTEAFLTGANLTEAFLTEAVLTKAVLTGADLTEANLSATILNEARLAYADLTGATYAPASPPPDPYLEGIKGLSTVSLDYARGKESPDRSHGESTTYRQSNKRYRCIFLKSRPSIEIKQWPIKCVKSMTWLMRFISTDTPASTGTGRLRRAAEARATR